MSYEIWMKGTEFGTFTGTLNQVKHQCAIENGYKNWAMFQGACRYMLHITPR